MEVEEDELTCPICKSLFSDPFVSSCGHTFCYTCISQHLGQRNSCPTCKAYITLHLIFPNFILQRLASSAQSSERRQHAGVAEQIHELLLASDAAAARQNDHSNVPARRAPITEEELERLLVAISARKTSMQQQSAHDNLQLLLHFLEYSRETKQRKLQDLQLQLKTLDGDMSLVASQLDGSSPVRQDGLGAPGISPQALLSSELLCSRLLESPDEDEQQAQGEGNGSVFGTLGGHVHDSAIEQADAQPDLQSIEQASRQLPLLALGDGAQSVPLVATSHRQQPIALHARRAGNGSRSSQGVNEGGGQVAVGSQQQDALSDAALHSVVPPMPYFDREAAGRSTPLPGQPGQLLGSHSQMVSVTGLAPISSPSAASGLLHTSVLPAAAGIAHPGVSAAPGSRVNPATGVHQPQTSQLLQQQQSGIAPGDVATREKRRRRFSAQLKDLQQCYLALRSNHQSQTQTPLQADAVAGETGGALFPGSVTGEGLTGDAATAEIEDNTISHAPPRSPPLLQHIPRLTMQQSTSLSDVDVEAATTDVAKETAGSVTETCEWDASPAAEEEGDSHKHPAPLSTHVAKRLRVVPPEGLPMASSGVEPSGLAEFSRMLSVFTHFGSLQVVAQVPRASIRQSSAILSSIEFDRDAHLFATAGVSKRICIFDFNRVMANPLETVHRPHAEVSTRSKLSCISWNKYVQSHLISSDYEGVVALWDVATGQQLSEYEAHQKRIWTVDFGHADPCHFVSGSDDGWVRVWSTHERDSLLQIDMKANVCCAKYNPVVPHQIVVGCADHCLHLYDLRKADRAVSVLEGHKKAVAYVRFMGASEVVTASTDSTLRLWDLSTQACSRTYHGHTNEKNFVGLSADGEFIACGSENNEIFVYYKSLSKPIAQRDFAEPPVSASGAQQRAAAGAAEAGHFISAVCWKPHTNTLLAANSSGVVSVCSLTHD